MATRSGNCSTAPRPRRHCSSGAGEDGEYGAILSSSCADFAAGENDVNTGVQAPRLSGVDIRGSMWLSYTRPHPEMFWPKRWREGRQSPEGDLQRRTNIIWQSRSPEPGTGPSPRDRGAAAASGAGGDGEYGAILSSSYADFAAGENDANTGVQAPRLSGVDIRELNVALVYQPILGHIPRCFGRGGEGKGGSLQKETASEEPI
jgi:hypothetical protein